MEGMKGVYVRAMDVLQRIAMIIAGSCLVVITLIIPWGVFTRYALGFGSSWPEPMAVLLMIWFSFTAAAVCYREGLHIGVSILPNALKGNARLVVGWVIELLMIATNLFILIWGTRLVATTWYQAIADFPVWTAGLSYLPVPVGGAIIVLFAIERLWTGRLFPEPTANALSHVSSE
jgi:TRAP-type C4-dicarboxylate transport system permease small subunit